MNAQTHFALMCAAMVGPDEWLARVQDEIDALQEEFVWPDDCHYEETEEYRDYQLDVEWLRTGC